MKSYLAIVEKIVNQGLPKQPVRFDSPLAGSGTQPSTVEHDTVGLPNVTFEHNLQDGFPLLTTRKMPFKSLSVELEGFIKGITDKDWYQARGCRFWDSWCNPAAIPPAAKQCREEVKEFMRQHADLGPIYGAQWRNFASTGYDQLASIAHRLRFDPNDRRMVCSAWVPSMFDYMALPPCHFCWNVTVYGGTLNLWWGQRSCDVMLGLPCNIASYALLASLLAEHAGLKVGKLTGMIGDAHIYTHHLPAARELLCREPRALPELMLRKTDEQFDIFSWTASDVRLRYYRPAETLAVGEITVL